MERRGTSLCRLIIPPVAEAREEASRRRDGMILIEQAISVLCLDITAEELLTEAETQRGSTITVLEPPPFTPVVLPSLTKRQKDDLTRMDRLTFIETVNDLVRRRWT